MIKGLLGGLGGLVLVLLPIFGQASQAAFGQGLNLLLHVLPGVAPNDPFVSVFAWTQAEGACALEEEALYSTVRDALRAAGVRVADGPEDAPLSVEAIVYALPLRVGEAVIGCAVTSTFGMTAVLVVPEGPIVGNIMLPDKTLYLENWRTQGQRERGLLQLVQDHAERHALRVANVILRAQAEHQRRALGR